MKKRVPVVEQLSQIECGLCCCLSILQYYKSKETLLDLRNEIEKGRDGYHIGDLKYLFENRVFFAESYKMKDARKLNELPLPLIAFWDNQHFIVIYKIKNENIYIMDPAVGYLIYGYEEFIKRFSNIILLVIPKESYKPRKTNISSPWEMVLNTFLNMKGILLLTLFFSIISYILTVYIPIFTSKTIDSALKGDFSLYNIIIFLFVLIFFYFLTLILRSMGILMSNIYFSKNIETFTFKKLLKLPYNYFEIRAKGDILYRISSISGFRELFTTQVVSGIIDCGTILTVTIYMFLNSSKIAWLTVFLSVINFTFLLSTRKLISSTINKELQEQSLMYSVENEVVNTISSIKISSLEDDIFQNWSRHLDKVILRYKERGIVHSVYSSVVNSFQIFAPLIVLIYGLFNALKGDNTFGEVIAYQSVTSILFSSEISIFNAYTQYILASSYLNRVNDIWCAKEEKNYEEIKDFNIVGNIKVSNLSFSYTRDSNNILNNINLDIKAGKKVAFVGHSGSGKSTLAKILAGLYHTSKGRVFFDGQDLRYIGKKTLSKNIGVVPQDVYLLNRSILENIKLSSNVSFSEVIEVCKAVQIYDEIMDMPMQFNTIISEMGSNISGGQRQRIALARALINKPKIVILDEATSSLDTINENKITNYLKKQGCTQIIIAHRMSTIIDADKIYVMKNGSIIESGTHDELMRNCDEYYKLYTKKEKEGENI